MTESQKDLYHIALKTEWDIMVLKNLLDEGFMLMEWTMDKINDRNEIHFYLREPERVVCSNPTTEELEDFFAEDEPEPKTRKLTDLYREILGLEEEEPPVYDDCYCHCEPEVWEPKVTTLDLEKAVENKKAEKQSLITDSDEFWGLNKYIDSWFDQCWEFKHNSESEEKSNKKGLNKPLYESNESFNNVMEHYVKTVEELKIPSMKEIKERKPEMVNHPDHYQGNGLEVIEVLKAFLTPEQFLGFVLANMLKYLLRMGKKDEMLQELEKTLWYGHYLKEFLNEQKKETKI